MILFILFLNVILIIAFHIPKYFLQKDNKWIARYVRNICTLGLVLNIPYLLANVREVFFETHRTKAIIVTLLEILLCYFYYDARSAMVYYIRHAWDDPWNTPTDNILFFEAGFWKRKKR